MTFSRSSRVAKNFVTRGIIIALIAALSLVSVFALSACEKDTHAGNVTFDVSTVDDLKALNDKLGADYDCLSVELKNDIDLTGVDWTPIGTDFNNSFRGVFNGNGYTIKGLTFGDVTASVTDSTAKEQSYTKATSEYVGLFGYSVNATFNKLNIDFKVRLSSDYYVLYVGGLTAYAYGDCNYSEIGVTGNVELLAAFYLYSNSNNAFVSENPYDVFAGGMVGYATGTTKANNVKTEVNFKIDEHADKHLKSEDDYQTISHNTRFKVVELGGAFGYVRTIDISAEVSDRNVISDVTSKVNAEVYAEYLYFGALVGSAYNTDISKAVVTTADNFSVNVKCRGEIGGVAGLLDACNADKLSVSGLNFYCDYASSLNSTVNMNYNVGGAVGYVTGGSMLSTVAVTADIYGAIDKETVSIKYAGGIVGVLSDSTLTDAAAKGTFYRGSSEVSVSNYDFGGAVGRAYAEAKIDEADVSFNACKSVIAVVSQKLVYKKITNDAGEEEIVEDKRIPANNEDGTVKNYVDSDGDSDVTYDATRNASCTVTANSLAVEGDSAFQTRFDAIMAKING